MKNTANNQTLHPLSETTWAKVCTRQDDSFTSKFGDPRGNGHYAAMRNKNLQLHLHQDRRRTRRPMAAKAPDHVAQSRTLTALRRKLKSIVTHQEAGLSTHTPAKVPRPRFGSLTSKFQGSILDIVQNREPEMDTWRFMLELVLHPSVVLSDNHMLLTWLQGRS